MLATAAVATTAAFAGGGLLSQVVVVPSWREIDPTVFLQRFPVYGPAMGMILFPIEMASVVLLGISTYSTIRHHRPGRLPWAAATVCISPSTSPQPTSPCSNPASGRRMSPPS